MQALWERLGETGAVDDDVGPGVGVLAHEREALLLVSFGGIDGQRGAEFSCQLETRVEPVDRDQLAATHKPRLDQVAEAKRADSDDGHRLAECASSPSRRQHAGAIEPMRYGHHLGQGCDLVRQTVGHTKERCSWKQVHVFRPAAEKVRRVGRMQAVAVVLQVLTEVVRGGVEAEDAVTAWDVRGGHEPAPGAGSGSGNRLTSRCPGAVITAARTVPLTRLERYRISVELPAMVGVGSDQPAAGGTGHHV